MKKSIHNWSWKKTWLIGMTYMKLWNQNELLVVSLQQTTTLNFSKIDKDKESERETKAEKIRYVNFIFIRLFFKKVRKFKFV